MSKAEILNELPKLTAAEREEVRVRLAELDEEAADAVAVSRSEELRRETIRPRQRDDVFRNARAAIQ